MLVTDNDALARLCTPLHDAPWIAIDTEFVREKTYYPRLCLVQLAAPGVGPAAIDALAPGIDLDPLFALLADAGVEKVIHAAAQDLAVLLRAAGAVPAPVFDTQIAAALAGYGDQLGYAALAARITGAAIDKGSQFTDWARRPLSGAQLAYALADVEHLGAIRADLVARLAELGRTGWAREEMAALADPAQYEPDPREQWRRVRLRRATPRALAVLREAAAWREETARARDRPRAWLVRDEALVALAFDPPRTAAELERARGVPAKLTRGRDGEALLEALRRGRETPESQCPRPAERPSEDQGALVALLRSLLEARCEAHGIAPGLVANRDDLERIARGEDASVRALAGWRRALWGEDALTLRTGEATLATDGEGVALVRLRDDPGADGPGSRGSG